MAHIDLPEMPGILSLFAFRPETAKPLQEITEALLRGPSSLTRGERELIAAVVSTRNDCEFCALSHGAFAAAQLPGGRDAVEATTRDPENAPISAKLKTLLAIAKQVERGGKHVTKDTVAAARAAGASDVEIHDTVLIAAAFCMFNRYVDGLAVETPTDADMFFEGVAAHVVVNGYKF
jgi:uncharacterized peroxidase-related enzyme